MKLTLYNNHNSNHNSNHNLVFMLKNHIFVSMHDLKAILETDKDKHFILHLLQFSKKNFDNSTDFFDYFLDALKDYPEIKDLLVVRLINTFKSMSMQKFLIDFGIFYESNFFKEMSRQIGNKILPEIRNDKTLLSLINEVLYSKRNHEYVKSIPTNKWEELYRIILNKTDLSDREYIKSSIREACFILMNRIIGGATDKEIYHLSYIKSIEANPFQLLSKELMPALQSHREVSPELIERFSTLINNCNSFLDDIINQKDDKGISLKITFIATRLRQQLDRLITLLKQLSLFDNESMPVAMANMTRKWLYFYSPKNKVVNSFSSTIYILTFLITSHNGKTGEHYITSTSKQYFKMLILAGGGGLIVAFLCFFKARYGIIAGTPFEEALLYSFNYAFGFVLIFLFHFTLATKQPAMTAASLAKALEKETRTADDYKEFAIIFSRLCRSQFIAFMGNVFAAFPVAIGIYYFLTLVLHVDPAYIIPKEKAALSFEEVVELHPIIFFYGAVAGVFLFISGMISGLVENYNRYRNVPERIFNHPFLKKYWKEKSRKKLTKWYTKNISGILGNVSLGFFLGTSFLISKFLGFPFDIRHITFSAGNYGLALGYFNFHIPVDLILKGFIGIFGIGIANFMVSFLLSLYVAMKSIRIPASEIKFISLAIFRLFIRRPVSFFFPPK